MGSHRIAPRQAQRTLGRPRSRLARCLHSPCETVPSLRPTDRSTDRARPRAAAPEDALRPAESPVWDDLSRPILDANALPAHQSGSVAWEPGKPLSNSGHLELHTLRLGQLERCLPPSVMSLQIDRNVGSNLSHLPKTSLRLSPQPTLAVIPPTSFRPHHPLPAASELTALPPPRKKRWTGS